MQCFDKYKDDRVCDLCSISNKNMFTQCKDNYDEKVTLRRKLLEIETKCPYTEEGWDEYERVTRCNKNNNGYGRHGDFCNPTLECEKYCSKLERNNE